MIKLTAKKFYKSRIAIKGLALNKELVNFTAKKLREIGSSG